MPERREKLTDSKICFYLQPRIAAESAINDRAAELARFWGMQPREGSYDQSSAH